jgi:ribose-phosphate pyrophosphokinase
MGFIVDINGYDYVPTVGNFPGGEVFLNFKEKRKLPVDPVRYTIKAKLRNSNDVMTLLMLKDALDRYLGTKLEKNLEMHYVPYARQDRVCNVGEALSIKVFANLINSMQFDEVIIADPHSDVTTALIDNVTVLSQVDISLKNQALYNKLRGGKYILVSPDAGAYKKTMSVAKFFGCEMISASKDRDVATGKIKEIRLLDAVNPERNYLIVDDICDGGGTFIPLAQSLRGDKNKVELYTTHGIYSKGVDKLLEVFDSLHTTDSYHECESVERVNVITL